MTRHTKHLLTTLTTTTLLAIAISSASANRLSITSQTIRATWTSLQFHAGTQPIQLCPVTLEGSFHSATIAKTREALVGYVTRASVNNVGCSGGNITIKTETLPWHIRYHGFSGSLPNITLIFFLLNGATFNVFPSGAPRSCTGRTENNHPAIIRIRITSGLAEELTPEPNARIPLEEFFCQFAGEGSFSSPSNLATVLGATTRITIRLI